MGNYSFLEILGWLLHAVLQLIRDVAPLIEPAAEPPTPPAWWYTWFSWSDWNDHLNAKRIPDSWLIDCYLRGSYYLFGKYISNVALEFANGALNTVLQWLGSKPLKFATWAGWIEYVGRILGDALPPWCASAVDGLARLYLMLPESIRTFVTTWEKLLEYTQSVVWGWVVARYEDARSLVYAVRDWLVTSGKRIETWYDSAHALLDEFRANPRGFVEGLLGETWKRLAAFAGEPLQFWFALWGLNAKQIGAFLSDPLDYLYSVLEDFVTERLW